MSDPAVKEMKAQKKRERDERYANVVADHKAHGVEFLAFPKIPRLNRDITITEKIDGTNAAIHITPRDVIAEEYASATEPDDLGRVVAQSRTRLLTLEEDNFGFAKWVAENAEALREVLGPGVHFGEWWGQGIQRGYKQTQKWFSLFNYNRWANDPSVAALATIGVQVIPVLYHGPWIAVVGGADATEVYPSRDGEGKLTKGMLRYAPDVVLDQLAKRGSVAAMVNGVTYKQDPATGDKGPEGIVVFHEAGRHLFKATIEADEQPKSQEARDAISGARALHDKMLDEIEREGLDAL